MAQKHSIDSKEYPMTREGRIQGPSRRYRRLRHPSFAAGTWAAKNPLLQRGEIGYEIDTHKVKIGDGVTYWNDLAYIDAAGGTWGDITGDIADQTDLTTYVANAVGAEATLRENADTGLQNQITTNKGTMDNHIANTSNPHSVTAAQVGLGNVDNTSDLNKPISTATQAALNNKQDVISDLATIRSDASAGKSASDMIATYGDIVTYNASDFATAAQGGLADSALQSGDNVSELNNDAGYLVSSDLSGYALTTDIPTTIAELTGDVAISSPANGNILTYNGTSQKWENTAPVVVSPWDMFDYKWRDATTSNSAWALADGNWINKADAETAYQHLVDDYNALVTSKQRLNVPGYTLFRNESLDVLGESHPYAYSTQDQTTFVAYTDVLAEPGVSLSAYDGPTSSASSMVASPLGPYSMAFYNNETIAGTTITYYLAADGHKICLADQKTNIDTVYSATGAAWCYILDAANERFILPRKTTMQIVRSVQNSDNSWYRLYANGWVEQGGVITVTKQNANTSQTTTVNLPVAMADTNYYVAPLTFITDGGNTTGLRNQANDRTTTQLKIKTYSTTGISNNYTGAWQVSGMSAIDMTNEKNGQKYLYFYVGE